MLAVYLPVLETEDDQNRFTYLFEVYKKKVFKVALDILENPVQAEDAAQQTWLRLWCHWEFVKELSTEQLNGYIITCANNVSIDMLRIERRVVPFPQVWDPPELLFCEDGYKHLASLIRALPERYRQILELKYIEEETNREIARRLKIKVPTVATRISRGKRLLKECLRKEGYLYG